MAYFTRQDRVELAAVILLQLPSKFVPFQKLQNQFQIDLKLDAKVLSSGR